MGDLIELCAGEPQLLGTVTAMRAVLEERLDTAQPFNDMTFGQLRAFVEWLPVAVTCCKAGNPLPSVGAVIVSSSHGRQDSSHESTASDVNVMLELNLTENRELLTEFHAATPRNRG